MGQKIDLLAHYPRANRNLKERGEQKTEEDRAIARRFGREFFDGDRRHGYGGYSYHPRFWTPVVPTFQEHFGLTPQSSVLDVGSGKGFMMHDIALKIPGITIKGIDISEYGVSNTIESMRAHVQVASADNLPFKDNSFDLVVSINTIHNLELKACKKALKEIERVSRGKSFITVDAYRSEEERDRMMAWNLTARTIFHADEWENLFYEVGYTGDYYWFIP